jgi:micrococcal nuclease
MKVRNLPLWNLYKYTHLRGDTPSLDKLKKYYQRITHTHHKKGRTIMNLKSIITVFAMTLALSHAIAKPDIERCQEAPTSGQLKGIVTKVMDGDTFVVAAPFPQKCLKVRLEACDTPESHQTHGSHASAALRALIYTQSVTIAWSRLDRYGRVVSQAEYAGGDICNFLVERGHAWVYKGVRKRKDMRGLMALEAQARDKRVGLWAQPNVQAPWDWRKENK